MSYTRDHVYKCDNCGKKPGRENLFSKKIMFTTLGSSARTIRSRSVGWFCGPCVSGDPDYNREGNLHPESRVRTPKVPTSG